MTSPEPPPVPRPSRADRHGPAPDCWCRPDSIEVVRSGGTVGRVYAHREVLSGPRDRAARHDAVVEAIRQVREDTEGTEDGA